MPLPTDKCPTRRCSGSHDREGGRAGLALGRDVEVEGSAIEGGSIVGSGSGDGGAEGKGDNEGFPALGGASAKSPAVGIAEGGAVLGSFITLLAGVEDAVTAPGEEAGGTAVVGEDIGVAGTVVAVLPCFQDVVPAERSSVGFQDASAGTAITVPGVPIITDFSGIEDLVAAEEAHAAGGGAEDAVAAVVWAFVALLTGIEDSVAAVGGEREAVGISVAVGITIAVGVTISVAIPVAIGVTVPIRISITVTVSIAIRIPVTIGVTVTVTVPIAIRIPVTIGVTVTVTVPITV